MRVMSISILRHVKFVTKNHLHASFGLEITFLCDNFGHIDGATSGGGLARLPVNLIVYISMCIPRGDSKLTPHMPILRAEIILFYECPLLSKIKVDFHIF